MEGFSDGVFGFAITLLVIDIAIHPPGTPLQQVLHAWPSYLAYVISFMTIGTAWLVHTAMTDQLAKVDPIFLRLNLLVLIVVVFLPFPTRLVADSLHDPSSQRVFVTMYGLTLLSIRLAGSALDWYARDQQLYAPRDDDDDLPSDRRKRTPLLIADAVAIAIGLAVPELAVALYFGLAVYAIVPLREAARLLSRSRGSSQ